MWRLVLDANVVASAFITPSGASADIVRRIFRDARYIPIVSPSILTEYHSCLFRPKVRILISARDAELSQFISTLPMLGETVAGQHRTGVQIRDPKDSMYIDAAVEGRAEWLVTGDGDLLELKTFDRLRIIRPREFLSILPLEKS